MYRLCIEVYVCGPQVKFICHCHSLKKKKINFFSFLVFSPCDCTFKARHAQTRHLRCNVTVPSRVQREKNTRTQMSEQNKVLTNNCCLLCIQGGLYRENSVPTEEVNREEGKKTRNIVRHHSWSCTIYQTNKQFLCLLTAQRGS